MGKSRLYAYLGAMPQATAFLSGLATLKNLRAVEIGNMMTPSEQEWLLFFQPLPLMTQIKCAHHPLI
jgi:hypothetical protein